MKKLLSIISLASVITFSLFVFMAYLINSDEINIIKPSPDFVINVYQTPEEKPAAQRPHKLPEPPKLKEPIPKMLTVVDNNPEDGGFDNMIIHIKAPSNDTGVRDVFIKQDHDARPIVRIRPKYPMIASRNGIEGWVKLAFDINKVGAVVNITIIDSYPKRTFDRAAKQALKKWKYKAKSTNGTYVYQADQRVQLDFAMDQQI